VIDVGQPAPDFELQTDAGDTVRLADLRGKKVVLYFYPKDDTPGCTKQACGIRDAWKEFRATGAEIFGISPQDAASHAKFKAKYDLPFTLLVDDDHKLADEFGFWKQKTMAGKKYMGIERSTVVIDEDGNVATIWRRVKPDEHTDKLLQTLR
jgi:thioredoxin-dependent peroxiredoxin